MAISWPFMPLARVRDEGRIWIWLMVALVTEMLICPVTSCNLAVTVATPAVLPVASPLLSTVSTSGLLLIQLTWDETSLTLPSEKVALAVSCCLSPLARVGGEVLIWILVAMALVTSNLDALLVLPWWLAEMIACPRLWVLAIPASSTVTMAESELAQVTTLVRSAVVPSL